MAETNPVHVSLREVTGETVRTICRLEVKPTQQNFVAPNALSIAEAYFTEEAWFRAIYADETPVGFVMLYDNATEGRYYLWRFMIDQHYQGLGYGGRALELVIDHVRGRPQASELGVSYVPGEGSPGAFYRRYGFVETGEVHGGERVMRLEIEKR
ncbi:MAG: GNAT family N-acetyltransferase [Trueperaceae bacterium]|nr:MAG: GNAT family N-acetyltransferase [Trueperaceae bacterium]